MKKMKPDYEFDTRGLKWFLIGGLIFVIGWLLLLMKIKTIGLIVGFGGFIVAAFGMGWHFTIVFNKDKEE